MSMADSLDHVEVIMAMEDEFGKYIRIDNIIDTLC